MKRALAAVALLILVGTVPATAQTVGVGDSQTVNLSVTVPPSITQYQDSTGYHADANVPMVCTQGGP